MSAGRWRRSIAAGWTRVRASRKWKIVAQVWIVIVSLILLRQSLRYTSLAASLSEWEFTTFGHSLPVFSLLLLVLILCVPAFVLLGLLQRRNRRERRHAFERGETPVLLRSAMRTERATLHVLTFGAAAALLLSLATLMFAYRLPTDAGPRQTVDARASGSPREGATLLGGTVLYRRTATFQQNVLVFQRTTQFAPVVDSRDPTRVRFLAQVTRERLEALDGGRNNPPFSGILRRNALPGPVLRLFQYAGFRIEPTYYVLFVSEPTMRWPFYVVAMNAGLVCIGLVLLGLFQRRRIHRLEGELDVVTRDRPQLVDATSTTVMA